MSWFQPTEETCPPLVAKGTVVEIPGFPLLTCLIPTWQGRYAVSCDGTVWSFWGRKWKQMHPSVEPSGHLKFTPMYFGRKEKIRVHRVVLEAFVGQDPGRPFMCRHLDGNPSNNWWWNLIWGSAAENIEDQRQHGVMRWGERHVFSVLTDEIVIKARELRRNGMAIRQIAKDFGISERALQTAVSGKSWKHLPGGVKLRKSGTRRIQDWMKPIMSRDHADGKMPIEIARDLGVEYMTVYGYLLRTRQLRRDAN